MIALLAILFAAQDEERPKAEFAPLIKVEGKVEFFGGTPEQAMEHARKHGKLVLVHTWAHW